MKQGAWGQTEKGRERERRRVGEVPRPSGSHRGNRYTHSHTHTQPHIHFPFSIMKTIRKHFPLVLHEPWPSSSQRDECADFWSWSGALQVLLNPLTWSPPRPSATPGITWQFSKSPQSALATLLITTTLQYILLQHNASASSLLILSFDLSPHLIFDLVLCRNPLSKTCSLISSAWYCRQFDHFVLFLTATAATTATCFMSNLFSQELLCNLN